MKYFRRQQTLKKYVEPPINGTIIHIDGTSILFKTRITRPPVWNGRSYQPGIQIEQHYIRVKDSTTGQFYTLSVPPNFTTCHQAIAWTFGLTPQQYKPKIQT